MKKFKIFGTVIALTLMVALCSFSVYALKNASFTLPDRNISFSASGNAYFNAEITADWGGDPIVFGFNELGELIDDSGVIIPPETGSVYEITTGLPDLEFADLNTVYSVSYQVTNTGEGNLTFKISGIAFDNIENQKYTTTIKCDATTINVDQNAQAGNGFEKANGTCSYTISIPAGETDTITVSYQLARMNESVSVTESLSLDFTA